MTFVSVTQFHVYFHAFSMIVQLHRLIIHSTTIHGHLSWAGAGVLKDARNTQTAHSSVLAPSQPEISPELDITLSTTKLSPNMN